MQRNIVLRLKRKIKMPRNAKIAKQTAKLKCPKNFVPQKFLALK